MTIKQKVELAVALLLGIALAASAGGYLYWRSHRLIVLQGAIVVEDSDAHKQRPISGVTVSAVYGTHTASVKSDSSGLFSILLQEGTRRGQPISFEFRHPDYRVLDLHEFIGDKLYIVQLVPRVAPPSNDGRPAVAVGNVTVRYSVKTTTEVNIGSAVKTFEVENRGNVPCRKQHPCSPDGKWKAALGSTSLDAGPGNQFRDARVSCIAGPCPFTAIENQRTTRGGQIFTVLARNWSDTATFLLEAEVLHTMPTDIAHEFYPVIFGRELSFTLPSAVEGITIEADINNQRVFFPLGPSLLLSWANCSESLNPDRTKVFRCGLKPGYQFR